MLRQITLNGQSFELRTLDGKIWVSDLVTLLAIHKRKQAMERSLSVRNPEERAKRRRAYRHSLRYERWRNK